jgi:predicted enzyme related to lactoylglutathione lyase
MSSYLWNVTLDCADAARVAEFWSQVTGWPATPEEAGEYAVRPPGEIRPVLYFTTVPEPRRGKNRMHLDLMPADLDHDAEIARLVSLGASVLSDRRPEYGWVVMADPEGNEFDLEPGPLEPAEE